jgi:hypothetical protein
MLQKNPEQAQINICYEKYQSAWAKQKAMLQQDTDFDIIQRIVHQLPNLENVTVRKCPRERRASRFQKRKERRRGREGERLLASISRTEDDEVPSRQLLSVLNAANKAEMTLKELNAGVISASMFDYVETFGAVCSNITSLTLKLYVRRKQIGAKGKHHDNIANGTIQNFLKDMRQLRVLNLDVSIGWAGRRIHDRLVELDSVFDTEHKWPLLEDLTIGNLKSSEDALMKVLSNHHDTLKGLQIDSHELMPGCWKSCFSQIQETLTLQKVGLSGTLYATAASIPQKHSQMYEFSSRSPLKSSTKRFLLHGGNFPQKVFASSNSVGRHRYEGWDPLDFLW